jgi:hypothetical protein
MSLDIRGVSSISKPILMSWDSGVTAAQSCLPLSVVHVSDIQCRDRFLLFLFRVNPTFWEPRHLIRDEVVGKCRMICLNGEIGECRPLAQLPATFEARHPRTVLALLQHYSPTASI